MKKGSPDLPSKAGPPPPPPPPLPQDPLPQLEGCELTLDWRDFKGLLEAAAARRPDPAPAGSPVTHVLSAVRARGEVEVAHAAGAGVARLSAELALEVLREGWTWVPLVEGDLALEEVTLTPATAAAGASAAPAPSDAPSEAAARPVALVERDGQHGLLLEGPLRGALRCELVLPLAVEAAQSALSFGFLGAPALELELRLPSERELDVVVEPAVRRETRREGKLTRVSASIPAPRRVRVSWTVALPEDRAPAPQAEPVLQAQTETLAQVGEGSLRVRAQVHVEVLRAPVRELFLHVPLGLTVTDLRAPRLAQWETAPASGEPGERLRVLLEQAVEGALALELDADRQLDDAGAAPLQPPRLEGATRDQGHLAVVALTNVDVAAEEVSGARRVDPRELPPRLGARATRAVVHAFHYAGTAPSLVLRATKHPELPVITTVIDRAQFLVMVTEDGQRYVQGRYTVRNAQQQFLRVALGPEEELLSALRDGDPVKPAQGEDHHVLVPLRRAATPAEADEAFTVEVVTRVPQDALRDRGALALTLPTVGLPVAYLTCELHLPRGYVYDDFTGSLHEVDDFQDPIVSREVLMARLAPPRPQIQAPPPARAPAGPPRAMARQQQMMAPPRMAMEASASLAAADPFAAGMAMEAPEEMAQGVEDYLDQLSNVPATLTAEGERGRLPIRIEIPEQGERFRFERILCLGEPLEVRTEYTRERR
ncbi:MAG: hypothetical protein AB7N76_29270 [Planctomycetota bacterium]